MQSDADSFQRCSDCLSEFRPGVDRFVVLARRHDVPADFNGTEDARRFAEWACFNQVFVCGDCAGWYGDEAIRVTADQALGGI